MTGPNDADTPEDFAYEEATEAQEQSSTAEDVEGELWSEFVEQTYADRDQGNHTLN